MFLLRNVMISLKKLSILNKSFSICGHKLFSNKIEQGDELVPRSKIKEQLENKNNIIRKQIKASGPGGQHVNKTNSAVYLKDLNTDISVKVNNSRNSEINNAIAKKRLVDKIDLELNGKESKIGKKIEKEKKQKNRNYRRSAEKHKKK